MNLLLSSERYCFLENQLANEKISKAEYSLMDTWFNWASNAFEKSVKPDVVGKYDRLLKPKKSQGPIDFCFI